MNAKETGNEEVKIIRLFEKQIERRKVLSDKDIEPWRADLKDWKRLIVPNLRVSEQCKRHLLTILTEAIKISK